MLQILKLPSDQVLWWWMQHRCDGAVVASVPGSVLDEVESRIRQGLCAVFFGYSGQSLIADVVLVVSVRDGLLWVDWLYAFAPGRQVQKWRDALLEIAQTAGFSHIGCRAVSVARMRLFQRIGFVGEQDCMVLEVGNNGR